MGVEGATGVKREDSASWEALAVFHVEHWSALVTYAFVVTGSGSDCSTWNNSPFGGFNSTCPWRPAFCLTFSLGIGPEFWTISTFGNFERAALRIGSNRSQITHPQRLARDRRRGRKGAFHRLYELSTGN